jgi:alpha-beta hydrolase superfamily lysophospholipase
VPSIATDLVVRDGTSLHLRHWPAPDGWASVLLIHGLAEHSGRYEAVGERLAAAGLDVQAVDLRGFGLSGGRRAWVERWPVYFDDLEDVIRGIRSEAPGRPLVVYGHSLGALLALGYALDGKDAPDLLVLSAPALEATLPAWKKVLAPILGRLAPTMMIANGLDDETLSRDPAVGVAYRADPLNVHSSTARLGAEAFAEQDRVRRSLDRLRIPTLVIHGGDDRLVPTATSAALEGLPGVTRRVYPGVRHELHNEPERDEVLADVVAWIREDLPLAGGRR